MRRGRVEYGRLVEDALRGVVRKVLADLAAGRIGPPHHYYITLSTRHPAVRMPDYLRERYPNEITVVLQHQYWDLEVGEEAFSVTLSFNDVPERLTVPFGAIRIFADPSAEFGLQFTVEGAAEAAAEAEGEAAPLKLPIATAEAATPSVAEKEPAKPEEEAEEAEERRGAEIVALDRFRKK